MNRFSINGIVKRFPGQSGWYYVTLDQELSDDLRPTLNNSWPALLKASFTINDTQWDSSIMPIKDGPLFIALPAKIRKTESIEEGQLVTVDFTLKI